MTRRAGQKLAERERSLGVDPDDEAARWLAEHDPPPEPKVDTPPKSKHLHRWRRRHP